ncbi:MAG: hypothetical protein JXQ73_05755 [Phycisphaerae bacterium]|nr:hypothetical protein [Phycisphaerae bacterium]
MSQWTRRRFLQTGTVAACAAANATNASADATQPADASPRQKPITFNICLHPIQFIRDPELGKFLVDQGIEKVWLAGYFYGRWCYDKDKIVKAKQIAEAAGLRAEMIFVPLGHPGNSLGELEELVPLTIPKHWRYRLNVDGKEVRHCGCLNDASWRGNIEALREARQMGFHEVFMDDDLRLSVGPGVIGGCFCPDCIGRFRKETGAADKDLDEIRRQVRGRIRGDALMQWLRFHGGRLTAFMDACNAVAKDLSVGIMVMYMGHEQAGIEINNLRRYLFRVGEGMFSDASFGNVSGKMISLASAMFHRCYAQRHLSYSESTAFPPTALSAENLGRKLAVPLMAGVGNAMFMSGIQPFPKTYWPTLSRHIRQAKTLSGQIPNERPEGAIKLWFGPGVRSVAGAWPLADCLALGIPSEVVTTVSPGGVYLAQAEDLPFLPEDVLRDPETTIVTSGASKPPTVRCKWLDAGREWPTRWQAKRAILPAIGPTPHVTGETPVAARWFPKAGKLLLWNLTDSAQQCDVACRSGAKREMLEEGRLALIDVG